MILSSLEIKLHYCKCSSLPFYFSKGTFVEQIWGPCVPLAGFSYTQLVIISCIRNGFSFVTGAVRVLPPPRSALG